jgi:hypothetical protein
LVILPLETDGSNHLAWKMRISNAAGSWRYFVDAITGQVLFRYSAARFACLAAGNITGMVYDVDPRQGPLVSRPFKNQYVYASAPPVQSLTDGAGAYCSPTAGKISMSLQGPYVSIGQSRGPGAHYDNGSGVWSTAATPVSSPHPYSANSVSVSTIDLTNIAPTAASFLPVFSSFHVGTFGGGAVEGSGDIIQDDQLVIYDGNNNAVANYVGDRAPFNGAEVHTRVMHLGLLAKSGGTGTGYDVAISSYLTLVGPTSNGAPDHTWSNTDTPQNLHSELSLFYHLNKMHDYFTADVDSLNVAPITKPVVAMAHVGPNLVNAFYDPDYDALFFGDVSGQAPSDAFADDATVPHHEYTHYVVEKIWSIQNYGQAGTISEANADYFSASSLNDSSIGVYVVGQLGGSGPLRELDTTKPGATNFSLCDASVTPGCLTPWQGEIHDDSPFISQALWDIRRDRMLPANLGAVAGQSCADNLEFQSLLFFPESFQELYEAMLKVDQLGIVAACGPANNSQSIISSAFNAHVGILIGAARGDAYEPNDGFERATDISTIAAVSATISPAADTDFYSFGAGAGAVQVTLDLPSSGTGLYKAYQLKLYNVSRKEVASAAPLYDGFGTLDGVCDANDCNSTQNRVQVNYNNPAGGLLYVEVVGGDSLFGSNSAVNSTTPYLLRVSFPGTSALSGSVVTAKFDKDVIGFTVNTSTFVSRQDWKFSSAQLRDQSQNPMTGTQTHTIPLVGDYLNFVSSLSARGQITGSVQLSTGFAARFPSVGTVYLEVFAADALGKISSMGLSNPLNLSASQAELTAYNNLFNPTLAQKATVKYAVTGAGHLTVKMYTITGRLVRTLYDGDVSAGKGSLDWNGSNSQGSVVASGVYVVRAVGPGLSSTQKIVVVK